MKNIEETSIVRHREYLENEEKVIATIQSICTIFRRFKSDFVEGK